MTIRMELDVDRVAVLDLRVEEDMHYPLEEPRKRVASEDEVREIVGRLLAGEFALVPTAVR